MFTPPKNPIFEALEKSETDRRYNLSNLEAVVTDGVKGCAWCQIPLKGRQLKWCGPQCSLMAWAWANPQKEAALHVLLARQDFKCLGCRYDYTPYLNDALAYLNRRQRTVDPASIGVQINERLMKLLKYKSPTDRRPEVDHVVPIHKGGVSIGLSNHQVLCYACHKAKTKIDNSGPRSKKPKKST